METTATVTVYSTNTCPYCVMAKHLLGAKGAAMTEIDVGSDYEQLQQMMARSGRRTVPQIFIGDVHVGGYDDLLALDRQGKLDTML
ncbi:glutaredoxin 3 [Undibacterium terreum]|uniref:Glutaredoxin n=1 Tax=Undibacterium terreum TaxID=1224302 RepID=A0A916UBM0_9BURK|nr:glutaredoxin 3 [Undibacterium terreum]GGC67671.1 glutaredoxin 3 [Undibacterium terreum]